MSNYNFDGYDSFIEEEEFDDELYAAEIAAANSAAGVTKGEETADQPAQTEQQELKRFCGYELPAGVDLSTTDIENPPGLAGRIVGLMRDGAHRQVGGGAYSLMALQILSATAGRVRGYKRTKLSLITITLGISAGGKDRPQSVAKNFMDEIGVAVGGDIRSDKDVVRAVVAHDGRCIYILDEAQKLLTRTEKSDSSATKNVQNSLMELITSDNFKLSEMHKNEFCERLQGNISKLEKRLSAKEDLIDMCNPHYDAEKKERLEGEAAEIKEEIEAVKRKMDTINTGIKDAAISFSAYSTPAKLADFIDEIAIESGFLGRGLIADCGSDAERLNRALMEDDDGIIHKRLAVTRDHIAEELKKIYEFSKRADPGELDGSLFVATSEAKQLIKDIGYFYDDRDEYRNHPRLGPLFRRIYERLCSISSILALDSVPDQGVAIVKVEHVLHALAAVLRSISMLESNLKINEGATSPRMEDKMKAVEEAIIKQLNNKDFKYKSKIKDLIKRRSFYAEIERIALTAGQDAFENAFLRLLGNRVITLSECKKKAKLSR